MDPSVNPTPPNKWYRRLTVVFAVLFATFWSLGSFFFWVLLGLTASFGFLTLNSSGIEMPSFGRSPSNPSPGNATGNRAASGSQGRAPATMFRILFFAIGGIILLSFFFSVISGSDSNSNNESINVDNTGSTPEDNSSLNDKGIAFYNQGQYDSALFYYEKALQQDPSDQYALYNKALVYFMKNDFSGSASLAKKCLRAHPDYNEAWWLLGDSYYSSHQYDSAAASLEHAYNNDFSDPDFLQLMADNYRSQNNLPTAIRFYKKVLEQDSTKIDVYQQLITLDPDNATYYRAKVKNNPPK